MRSGHWPLFHFDFIAEGFDCTPRTLAGDFLFRHIHPSDPPGKTLLQFIDADTAIRVDLFRANGATMSRNICADLPSGPIQIVSVELGGRRDHAFTVMARCCHAGNAER